MDDGLGRIIRLVGDGRDEMSGGGLPLPDAFGAVLEHLLDEGPASQEALAGKIISSVSFKEKRILAIWGSWAAFTEEIIIQLGLAGLIRAVSRHDEGKVWHWRLSDDFREGTHEIVSSPAVSRATGGMSANPVTATVFSAATRAHRNETARLMFAVAEVQGKVAKARRMSEEMEERFREITRELEGEGEGRPGKPEAEPDVIVTCRDCGQPKARTYADFTVYWSRDRWRWQLACRICRLPPKYQEFQGSIITAVTSLSREDGTLPSVEEVTRQVSNGTTRDRTIARSWDKLAEKGLLPARPDQGRSRGRPRQEPDARRPGKVRITGQAGWYRGWIRTAGWHTQMQARAAWNEKFPDRQMLTDKASAFRHAAKDMIDRGEMEKRSGVKGEGNSWAFEYRWIPPEER